MEKYIHTRKSNFVPSKGYVNRYIENTKNYCTLYKYSKKGQYRNRKNILLKCGRFFRLPLCVVIYYIILMSQFINTINCTSVLPSCNESEKNVSKNIKDICNAGKDDNISNKSYEENKRSLNGKYSDNPLFDSMFFKYHDILYKGILNKELSEEFDLLFSDNTNYPLVKNEKDKEIMKQFQLLSINGGENKKEHMKKIWTDFIKNELSNFLLLKNKISDLFEELKNEYNIKDEYVNKIWNECLDLIETSGMSMNTNLNYAFYKWYNTTQVLDINEYIFFICGIKLIWMKLFSSLEISCKDILMKCFEGKRIGKTLYTKCCSDKYKNFFKDINKKSFSKKCENDENNNDSYSHIKHLNTLLNELDHLISLNEKDNDYYTLRGYSPNKRVELIDIFRLLCKMNSADMLTWFLHNFFGFSKNFAQYLYKM
ncbi:Plasmodium exported protein (PHISTb), unknown function [Plasmodium reichenowi]|uniref:Plasmodium RESA N-terminal domain-containing protein n=1 Tax=Plasmodium reichenowi TaxID=5854 RepID=A0A2P9DC74_PLARE|nr:Plasmodium exported protein (PHISTb), unknown function [Plasmodium reichenowi]